MELVQKTSWWIRYKNHVSKVVLNNGHDDRERVSYWRNAVFCNILTYLTPLSLIALIPSVYMAFVNGVPVVGFADLFTFFLVVMITVSPGIKLEIRKSIFIFIIYCLSVTLLFYLPLPGPGLLFLLTITIFSSLLYSASAAYYSAWINTAICLGFALLIYFEGNVPVSEAYRLGAWIAVSSNLVLLSFACAKCLNLLLGGLTVTLKNNKIAEEKFEKTNRLYLFISQINQCILHTKDEKTLFQNSCHIAQTIGRFRMAWIGKFDHDHKKIVLTHQNGIPEESIALFSASYENNGPQDHVLRSGTHYVCNNISNDLELENWKPFAALNGIRSCIILPIKKEGQIIGSFNLYSTEIDFFDDAEIELLEKATGEISFALDVFEKEKRHKLAEDTIARNEKRFTALVEKSADMQTLATIDGKLFYASPSTSKILGYTPEDFINTPAAEIIHPDDIAHVFESVQRTLQTEGSSFNSQHRLKHKNGSYIWCEGTMTNLLHEPHVNAMVSNFRDISNRKIAEEKLVKSNRLYSFISAINQSIVHIKEEKELLEKACSIAMEIGSFKLAWIGLLNEELKLEVINVRGERAIMDVIDKRAGIEVEHSIFRNTGVGKAMRNGIFAVSNDALNDPDLNFLKDELLSSGIRSNIVFPIKKSDQVAGVFSFSSDTVDFFDEPEIALLQEATGDISFALDVFEKEKQHKLAEEKIIQNENRFRSLIEKSTDVKTLTNEKGRFIYGSPSVTTLFGYTMEEFLNKPAFNFFHPDDLPDLLKNRNDILQTPGKSFSFQYRILHKNGSWVWCEGTLTNMLHEPGINALVSNFKDISKSRELSNRLHLATTSAGIGIWDWDLVNNHLHWDERMYSLYHISENEFGSLYDGWMSRLHEDDRLEVEEGIQNAITGKNEYDTEFRIVWNDLSIHYIKATGTIERNTEGNAIRMIGANWDITELKKKEEEKEKIATHLIQRNKNLEQFSYIISHNLRAPVANILGFAELMKYEKSNPGLVPEAVKGMSLAAKNMDLVIKDLNEILKINTIVSENREEVHFQKLVDDISLSIDNIIREENVVIRTDFKSTDKILSVKGYLYSIFYNLIINSIKFHKPGIPPVIEIKSRRIPNGVQIIFKDNGMGLDLVKNRENLFGLYKRFHPNTEGKGMGMFMIKTQVETLGGQISITSEVNNGAEFIIEFNDIYK